MTNILILTCFYFNPDTPTHLETLTKRKHDWNTNPVTWNDSPPLYQFTTLIYSLSFYFYSLDCKCFELDQGNFPVSRHSCHKNDGVNKFAEWGSLVLFRKRRTGASCSPDALAPRCRRCHMVTALSRDAEVRREGSTGGRKKELGRDSNIAPI